MSYKIIFVATRPSTAVSWYPGSEVFVEKYINTGKVITSFKKIDELTAATTLEFSNKDDFVDWVFDTDLAAYRDAQTQYNNENGILTISSDRFIL